MTLRHRRLSRAKVWFQSAVRLLVVAGWLVSTDGILPGLSAILVSFESAHGLMVRTEADGDIRLTLHDLHEGEAQAEEEGLTRLLLLLTGESSTDGPTHELSFENRDEARRSHVAGLATAGIWPVTLAVASLIQDWPWRRAERACGWASDPAWRGREGSSAGSQVRASRSVMLC